MEYSIKYIIFLILAFPLLVGAQPVTYQNDIEFSDIQVSCDGTTDSDFTLSGTITNNGDNAIYNNIELWIYLGRIRKGNAYGLTNGNNGNGHGNGYGNFSFSISIEIDESGITDSGHFDFTTGFSVDEEHLEIQENIVVIYPDAVGNDPNGTIYEGELCIPIPSETTIPLRESAPQSEEHRIFPNPAKDEVVVIAANYEEFSWTFMDITGHRILQSHNSTTEARIPVASLEQGLYLISIINAIGEQTTRKVLVSKK